MDQIPNRQSRDTIHSTLSNRNRHYARRLSRVMSQEKNSGQRIARIYQARSFIRSRRADYYAKKSAISSSQTITAPLLPELSKISIRPNEWMCTTVHILGIRTPQANALHHPRTQHYDLANVAGQLPHHDVVRFTCVNTALSDDPQNAVGHPRLSEVDLPLPCPFFYCDLIRIYHCYGYAALPPQRELRPTERPQPLPRLWLLSYTAGQYHLPTFTIAK